MYVVSVTQSFSRPFIQHTTCFVVFRSSSRFHLRRFSLFERSFQYCRCFPWSLPLCRLPPRLLSHSPLGTYTCTRVWICARFLRLQVSNVSSTFRFFVLSSVLCCSALAILFYPLLYLLEVFVVGIRDYLEILYNLYAFLRSSRFFKSLLRNLIIIKLVGKFRLLLLSSE